MWCPDCKSVNYNKDKCDFCGCVLKESSKISSIIHPIKKIFAKNTQKLYQDHKMNSDTYQTFIVEHYRQLGCQVIEYGKEKGINNEGVDLVAKLGNDLIFVHCIDWNEKNAQKIKINHHDIEQLRRDANDFLTKNPIYKKCEIKFRYILSGDFLYESAEKYMKEYQEDIDYEIVKPTYRKEKRLLKQKPLKQTFRNNTPKDSVVVKILMGVFAAMGMVTLLTLIGIKEKGETHDINKTIVVKTENNFKGQEIKVETRTLEQDTVFPVKDNKSARQKAKENLMIQMQN